VTFPAYDGTMYVVKKKQKENKNNKQKGNKQKKKNKKKLKKILYDSLVLYLTKKWLNP
jgi:phage head maturation protease